MRLILNILIVVSILYFPWWLGALVVTLGFFLVDRFYEGVFYGIVCDAMYGTSFGVYGFQYLATIYTSLFFFLANFVRGRLAL